MDKQHPALLYKTSVVAIIVMFVGASITPLVGSLSIQRSSTFGNACNSGISLITIKVDGEMGLKDWYEDNVFLNFTEESDDIAEIVYIVDGGAYQTYTEPFYLIDDGEDIMLEWRAINHEGNYSSWDGPFFCSIDQTKPEIWLTYEILGGNLYQGWDFEFTATATDAMSGMERVEFYYKNKLKETVIGLGPDYIWLVRHWPTPSDIFRATAYDKAGHSKSDEIYSPCDNEMIESSMFQTDFNNIGGIDNILDDVSSSGPIEKENHVNGEVFDPGYVIVEFKKDTGENDWLINVSIPIYYELDRVDEVYYQINDEGWKLYADPVVFSDGFYNFSWYVVDSEGYTSTKDSLSSFKMDATSPEISLTRQMLAYDKIKFTADVHDETSGIERVKFSSKYGGSYTDYDYPFEWVWTPNNWIGRFFGDIVTASVFDMAGNSNTSTKSTWISSYSFNQESRHGSYYETKNYL